MNRLENTKNHSCFEIVEMGFLGLLYTAPISLGQWWMYGSHFERVHDKK